MWDWLYDRPLRRLGLDQPARRPLAASVTIAPVYADGLAFPAAPYASPATLPSWWNGPSWPDPSLDPGHPAFELAPRLGIAFGPAAEPGQRLDRHIAYLDAVKAWATVAKERAAASGDPDLAFAVPGFSASTVWRGEADLAKRIAFQNCRHYAAPIGVLGQAGKPTPPAGYARAMRAVVRRVVAGITRAGPDAVDALEADPSPIWTNGGWPAGFSGPAANLIAGTVLERPAIAAAARASPADAALAARHPGRAAAYARAFYDAAAQFGHLVNLSTPLSLAFLIGYRSGPAAKAFPEWLPGAPGARWPDVAPGIFSATHEVLGGWARSRHIFMAPKVANLECQRLWAALYTGLKVGVPGFDHTGTVDDDAISAFARAHPRYYVAESDISGYDQNVSTHIQDVLEAELVSALATAGFTDLADAVGVWRMLERAPVVTPSWRLGARSLLAVGAWGGTHSGLKLTSIVGTLLCLAATLYALEEQHPGAIASWEDGSTLIPVLGDDILVYTTYPLDVAAWTAAWDAVGLPTKLYPSSRFLMRYRSPAGSAGSPSRVLQNSAYPEEPYDDADDADGAAAVGAWAIGFVDRARGAYDTDDPTYLHALRQLAPLASLPFASLHGAARAVEVRYAADMTRALEAASAANLGRLIARAPYDGGAATMLAAIAKHLGLTVAQLTERHTRAARDLWAAARQLQSEPLQTRLDAFWALTELGELGEKAMLGRSRPDRNARAAAALARLPAAVAAALHVAVATTAAHPPKTAAPTAQAFRTPRKADSP